MAKISWFLSYIVLLCLVRTYTGHPVSSSSQCQSDSAAVASLTAFALRLNRLERKIESHRAAIDRHANAISRQQNEMQIKASHNTIDRIAETMRGEVVSIRQQAEIQRAYTGLYVEQLRRLSGAFQVAERDFRHGEAEMREVKSKFDNIHLVCRVHKTKWVRRANGAILFLDRHLVRCSRGEVLQQFVMQKFSDRPASLVRYHYVCCKLNF